MLEGMLVAHLPSQDASTPGSTGSTSRTTGGGAGSTVGGGPVASSSPLATGREQQGLLVDPALGRAAAALLQRAAATRNLELAEGVEVR